MADDLDSKKGIVSSNRSGDNANQLKLADGADVEEAEDYKYRGGRPPKEIDADTLRKLSAMQCTIEEIGAFFNISSRQLIRRLKGEPLKGAYELGKLDGRISLRRLQWRHAQGTGGSAVQMTIWMSRNHLGETDRTADERRGGMAALPAPGDTPPRVVIEGGLPELPQEVAPELPAPQAEGATPAEPVLRYTGPVSPDDDGLQ